MRFVNRNEELTRLTGWWEGSRPRVALVWGRRRVGKTMLLQKFAGGRRHVFHTLAGRAPREELALLGDEVRRSLFADQRGLPPALAGDPRFPTWDVALEALAHAALDEPLLVVLDEFQEALPGSPQLPNLMRAVLDKYRESKLRLLLCGSAMRVMEQLQEARNPLYGRVDLNLLVHPFRPHEAASMLASLPSADRALVWGLVGGVPLYLDWWDEALTVRDNLLELVCTPGGRLLTEAELVLQGDQSGDLGKQVLFAIASGKTRHKEISDTVGTEPARTLERLIDLRLVERIQPVTDRNRLSRRRIYRIADNFIAFALGTMERHRAAIERGLGRSVLNTLMASLDDHMGPVWEEAFRQHLVRLAEDGMLGEGVVAIGSYWGTPRSAGTTDTGEIDAVVLSGRGEEAVLVGEAKWARRVDARPLESALARKALALPVRSPNLRPAVAAREEVVNAAEGTLTLTSGDIFG